MAARGRGYGTTLRAFLQSREDEKTERGSGNVFADLGVAHPERMMARAQVMSRIAEILTTRGFTQKKAARMLGIPQSKVSCLLRGKLSMFSLDRLFELLNALELG